MDSALIYFMWSLYCRATMESNSAEGDMSEDLQLVSPEDRELLSVYQQSFDDDKVDIVLVTELILKIHTTQPEGAMLVFLPGYDDIVAVANAVSNYGQLDR